MLLRRIGLRRELYGDTFGLCDGFGIVVSGVRLTLVVIGLIAFGSFLVVVVTLGAIDGLRSLSKVRALSSPGRVS